MPLAAPIDALGGRSRDAALATGIAAGDHAAFAAVYTSHAPAVAARVRRVLRDPAMSDEVAHDVLAELWRTGARDYDPGRASLRTWLLLLAHRRAVDRVRSEQSRRQRDERIGSRALVADVPDLEAGLDAPARAAAVHAALDRLGPLQRRALDLAFFGGLTYVEVAAELDIPLGTAKTRIRDALLRLRRDLTEAGLIGG